MAAPKKLKHPVYVTTVLEEAQHEALRRLAYETGRPMAALIREVLNEALSSVPNHAKKSKGRRRASGRKAA